MPEETRLVLRSEEASYMNVGTKALPVWERIGEGFTDLTTSYNTQEYTAHYIHEKTERTMATGYATSVAFTADVYKNDPVINVVRDIIQHEKLGSDAIKQILTTDLYEPVGTDETIHPARVRDWSVVPGDMATGVDALIISGTFKAAGDTIFGTFDPATKTFTPESTATNP